MHFCCKARSRDLSFSYFHEYITVASQLRNHCINYVTAVAYRLWRGGLETLQLDQIGVLHRWFCKPWKYYAKCRIITNLCFLHNCLVHIYAKYLHTRVRHKRPTRGKLVVKFNYSLWYVILNVFKPKPFHDYYVFEKILRITISLKVVFVCEVVVPGVSQSLIWENK